MQEEKNLDMNLPESVGELTEEEKEKLSDFVKRSNHLIFMIGQKRTEEARLLTTLNRVEQETQAFLREEVAKRLEIDPEGMRVQGGEVFSTKSE